MPIRRREISIFSTSFLDVISCGFGAVLLVFLLVATQSIRQAQKVEKQHVALAIRLQPLDDNGKVLGEPLRGKLELVVPPQGQELTKIPPPSWVYRPNQDNLSAICRQATVQTSSSTLFCVLRGVRVKRCYFRIRIAQPSGQPLKRIHVQGWLADPALGHSSLDRVFVQEASEHASSKNHQVLLAYSPTAVVVFQARLE